MLNDAFVSIVAPTPGTQAYRDGRLCVRARVAGDIQRVFGKGYRIEEGQGSDYRFRTFIPKEKVAAALALAVENITYQNFKHSVKDKARHDAYMRVWSAMVALQVEKGGRGWEYGGPKHAKALRVVRQSRREATRHGGPEPRGMSDEDWDDFIGRR